MNRGTGAMIGMLLGLLIAGSAAAEGLDRVEREESNAKGEPTIRTEAGMKQAMQQYIDGFNQGNAEMLYSLFAEHAKIEDPVGGGRVVEGKEAITAFYKGAVDVVERLELNTPIRGSHGASAAMAFTIYMKMGGKRSVIRAIDVMTFDDAGKIIDMKAYHGPSDVVE